MSIRLRLNPFNTGICIQNADIYIYKYTYLYLNADISI